MFIKTTVYTWQLPDGRYRVRDGELIAYLNTDCMSDVVETSDGTRLEYLDSRNDNKCRPSLLECDMTVADFIEAADTEPETDVISIDVFPNNDTTQTAQSYFFTGEEISYIIEAYNSDYCWLYRTDKHFKGLRPILIDHTIDELDTLGISALGGGRGNPYKVDLPKQLVLSPYSFTDEMDAIGDWQGSPSTTIEVNSVQFISGEASLKLTGTAGNNARIDKDTAIDLSSGKSKSIVLDLFLHSSPDTVNNIVFYISDNSSFANYNYCFYDPAEYIPLVQGQWNKIYFSHWMVGDGNLNLSNIGHIRIAINPKNGDSIQCSIDEINAGFQLRESVLIMFDEIYSSTFIKAYPLLKSKNMIATGYINLSVLNSSGFCTNAQLIELYGKKWDIGNHSQTHVDFTTLTKEEIKTELTNCKNALDSLGLNRASSHIAYPGGRWNNTVNEAMIEWGGKTGRGGPLVQYIPMNAYDGLFPYELYTHQIDNTDSVDSVKTKIQNAYKSNYIPIILFHELVDSNANVAEKWIVSYFSDLLDYLESENIQTLTIDEYYRLYSSAITVHHK
jgi:peptidoglycan/xylan/chitin deacetylase (PgdA/CDA1 family)